jgi:pyridoxamine 5'-phosphate oxidase
VNIERYFYTRHYTFQTENPFLMGNNIFTEYGEDPLAIFQKWYDEAVAREISDPNAMALATIDPDSKPSVRIVLLKGFDQNGFTFFTNYDSRKGLGLQTYPYAEMNFYWKSTEKQIRISGPVVKTSEAEADAYFATRARDSQLGAWASWQTRTLDDYKSFETRVAETRRKFEGQDIPRPAYWGGFRLRPERMEFWIARPNRLHKRFVFEKNGNQWNTQWLFP